MKAVKVQYTVRQDYVSKNKENIRRVMAALQAKPVPGMQYSTYTDAEHPNTFIHINMAKDGPTMAKLGELPEFKAFRKALMESNPIESPNQTQLNLVGAGFELA